MTGRQTIPLSSFRTRGFFALLCLGLACSTTPPAPEQGSISLENENFSDGVREELAQSNVDANRARGGFNPNIIGAGRQVNGRGALLGPNNPATGNPAFGSNFYGGFLDKTLHGPARAESLGRFHALLPAIRLQDPATWKASPLVANSLRLMVGDKRQLPLKGLQVSVKIEGFRARVLLDAYFRNPHSRAYEGSFQLRLPDGASPHYLAFGETILSKPLPADFHAARVPVVSELDGLRLEEPRSRFRNQPKVARMVPVAKAAEAYKAVVRRRIDPALLEWAGAGVFQARVFPILANRTHRVVIAYDLDLKSEGEDLALKLDLPDVPARRIDLELIDIPGVATDIQPEPDWIDGRKLCFLNTEAKALRVRLERPGVLMLTGADKAGPRFATRLRPDLPDSPVKGRQRAVFLVDLSLSARHRYQQDLELLGRLLTANRDEIKEFALLFFNVERFWYREEFSQNTRPEVAEALRFARRLVLEGATDLAGAIDEATKPTWAKELGDADLFLLSDGAANWGDSDLSAMREHLYRPGVGSLFAYRSAELGADDAALNALAREKGGALFTAVSNQDRIQAARAHRSRPWIIESVAVPGGEDLLIAGRPYLLYPGQELAIVGRGEPSLKAIELRLRQGSAVKDLSIPIDHQIASRLAPRTYGQVAVAQLDAASGAEELSSQNMALYYRITGERCSLLMLESEADYEAFNIEKPEKLAAAIAAWSFADELDRLYDPGAAARDPKADFLAFVARLEKTPGMNFELSAEATELFARLSSEDFRVAPSALRCRLRFKDLIPKNVLGLLKADQPDYDALVREAERRRSADPADAVRALSSLIESRPGDGSARRDVAQTLLAWGRFGHAYHLLRRQVEARPFEPLPYLLMASGAAESGRPGLAAAWFEVALAGKWDTRFGEIRAIAERDYRRILAQILRGAEDTPLRRFARAREASIKVGGQADLVVMLSWATDNTDIDLHVTEPGGEEVFYLHRESREGGRLTRDVTRGYGPEMYVMPKAPAGDYKIDLVYYNANANRVGTRTRSLVTVVENWGRPNERLTRQVVGLKSKRERSPAATVKRARP